MDDEGDEEEGDKGQVIDDVHCCRLLEFVWQSFWLLRSRLGPQFHLGAGGLGVCSWYGGLWRVLFPG